jgi:hypothetical protein
VSAPSIDAAMSLFEGSDRGVSCQAAATILARVYEAAGFPAWVISFGDLRYLTHTTTVVQNGARLYIQDAYFNPTLGDENGTPMRYSKVIERLSRRQSVSVLQDVDERVGLFRSADEAKAWVPDDYKSKVDCLQPRAVGAATRCRLIMTFTQFEKSYTTPGATVKDVHDFLKSRGWSPSFMYLMMFPLWETSS